MKKVWMEFKMEFTYAVANMWYYMNKYIVKHDKSFNKTFKKFAWNMHIRWIKRFDSLYEELELSTNK